MLLPHWKLLFHILQGYFTDTGAIIWLPHDCPIVSDVTLKNMGKDVSWIRNNLYNRN